MLQKQVRLVSNVVVRNMVCIFLLGGFIELGTVGTVQSLLYSDGFSHTDKYNRDRIVHYIFQRVTGGNFQMNMYFSP